MSDNYIIAEDGELYHWGVKGMRWGVRRYQNEDGSLTSAGKKRYSDGHSLVSTQKPKLPVGAKVERYEKRKPPIGAKVDGYEERKIPTGAKTLAANSSSVKKMAKKGAITLGASAAIAGLLTLGVSAAVDRAASVVINGAKSVHDAFFDNWW